MKCGLAGIIWPYYASLDLIKIAIPIMKDYNQNRPKMKYCFILISLLYLLLIPDPELFSQISSGTPDHLSLVRVYSDSIGETHFEDIEIKLDESDFAPPAPPIFISNLQLSTKYGFLSVMPGWSSDWHPTPKRQYIIYLSGMIEAEVSDGEIRQFRPGSITLVEDTVGKGHKSRAIGNDQIIAVIIQLE